MPDDYRKTLIRQISQHAHSGCGYASEGNWITRAPNLRRKAVLLKYKMKLVMDFIYIVLAKHLVQTENKQLMTYMLVRKYSSIFNYPTLTWADMRAIGWLVDGAAIMNQFLCAGVLMDHVSNGSCL